MRPRLDIAPVLHAVGYDPMPVVAVRDVSRSAGLSDYNAPARPEPAHSRGHGYVAEQLGVCRRTVARWIRAGSLPLDQGDVVAVALGRTPGDLWGNDWWAAWAEVERMRHGSAA